MSIRTRQRGAVLLLTLLPLMMSPAVAFAQAAPAAPAAPSARERLNAGDRLQRLHLFEPALAEYQKAYELAPTASTMKRIAETQRSLGDNAGATASFEKLATLPDASRDDKRAGEKALKALETESGTLTVTSNVEGAAVLLDGRELGTTPIAKPLRAVPGTHAVRITKEGYEPFSTEVNVAAGASATVDARLATEVQTGSVLVREKSQRPVTIAIDGRPAGKTPFAGELSPGEHTFEISEPKMTSLRLTVKIVARQRAEVVLEGTDTFGVLKIDAQPPEAEITVDGKPITAGTHEVDLPFGRHELSARAKGFNSLTETVDVNNAKGATWSVRLARVTAGPVAKEQDDSGGHFDIAFAGAFPLHASVSTCPPEAGTRRTCDDGSRLGGGLLLRGGYNFGVLGIDVTGLAFANHASSTVDYPGGVTVQAVPEATFQHKQTYDQLDIGGILAIGPTATSHGDLFRVTGGIAGGLAVRGASFRRTLSGQLNDEVVNSTVLFAPAGVAHLSMLLGSTPGAKLEIGIIFAVEKQSYTTNAAQRQVVSTTGASANTSVPAYDVYKDVQLFIGPTLGGRFGY